MSDLSFVMSGLTADRPPSDPLMAGRLFWATDTREMFSDSGSGWTCLIETDAAPEISSMRTLGYTHGQASFGDHSHPNALPGPTVRVGDYALIGGLPVILGNSHGEIINRDWNETDLKWEYQFVDQHGATITADANQFAVIDAPTPRLADFVLVLSDPDWGSESLPSGNAEPGRFPATDAGKAAITINADDGLGNITTHAVVPWSCAIGIGLRSQIYYELEFNGYLNQVADDLEPLVSGSSDPDYWTVAVYESKAAYEGGGTPLLTLYDEETEEWEYPYNGGLVFGIEVDARDPDHEPIIDSLTEYMQTDRNDTTITRTYVLFMAWRETPRVPNTLNQLNFQGSGLNQRTLNSGTVLSPEFGNGKVSWELHSTDPDGNAAINKLRQNNYDDGLEENAAGNGLELNLEPTIPKRLEPEIEAAGTPDRWTFEIYASESAHGDGDDPLASVSGATFYRWDADGERFQLQMLNTDTDVGTEVQAAMDAMDDDLASASLDYFYEVICYWD